MYFNSSSTLLFHFNTFTAAVAEVPQLIVPRAGKGVVTHQIDRLLRGSTGTGAGVQLHAKPILHTKHKLRSPQVKTKVTRNDN
jgi:hypothetical protein